MSSSSGGHVGHVAGYDSIVQGLDVPVKVTLIERHQILASFDKRLQAYAEKKLSERKNFSVHKSAVIGKDLIGAFSFSNRYQI